MSNKLLIDAAFPEETRLVLLNDKNIIENIDEETSSIKHLKGNIYLAKIIRLEPSLQSAFVNYGGDRHGFLPMSDIHPDYYNIPEDRKTDLTAVKFLNIEEKKYSLDIGDDDEAVDATEEDFENENPVAFDNNNEPIIDNEISENISTTTSVDDVPNGVEIEDIDFNTTEEEGETEETAVRYNDFRKYKIEEVLKEGQYLLVQVLKEERGNKGVALTTYLSIAGKYSVLMANVEGKGGISKKITNLRDRKILKNILNTLNPDESKSVIIRTAGVGKKPEEILRDYIYLQRLWSAIKQTALESVAPAFLHSEDDILKRAIRDLCNDKVKEIIVEGSNAFKTIKTLTNLIIPEQKAIVKEHTDRVPLFYKYKVEDQVNQLCTNRVELPSGGSIVIDQTEALVTIDVNSGKATKEKSVEEMALTTNMEAAKEIARQLRLRNIGGLIVIDFIDMFESKNRRTIERLMRDETSMDKAKIQIDKITIFGLLEMSRQRINASLSEKVSEKCPNCEGRGVVKSRYIVANNILRAIKYATREKYVKVVNIITSSSMVNFMLNYERNEIIDVESSYNINVIFTNDDNKENNSFEIIKRDGLTEYEKFNLYPTQHVGKVNELFDDDTLYNSNDEDEFNIEFSDECYYDKASNYTKKRSNTKNNRYQNTRRSVVNRKNEGFFSKIKKFFK
ncbi:MAG: Rne/Rng family ribonuclease [Rickettsiales bacterium]|nr:Rne/Rng family ribonuclease [Rickettsiales bacterium]